MPSLHKTHTNQEKTPKYLKQQETPSAQNSTAATPTEAGGQKGPEPTRYGDWEKNGLISDF